VCENRSQTGSQTTAGDQGTGKGFPEPSSLTSGKRLAERREEPRVENTLLQPLQSFSRRGCIIREWRRAYVGQGKIKEKDQVRAPLPRLSPREEGECSRSAYPSARGQKLESITAESRCSIQLRGGRESIYQLQAESGRKKCTLQIAPSCLHPETALVTDPWGRGVCCIGHCSYSPKTPDGGVAAASAKRKDPKTTRADRGHKIARLCQNLKGLQKPENKRPSVAHDQEGMQLGEARHHCRNRKKVLSQKNRKVLSGIRGRSKSRRGLIL